MLLTVYVPAELHEYISVFAFQQRSSRKSIAQRMLLAGLPVAELLPEPQGPPKRLHDRRQLPFELPAEIYECLRAVAYRQRTSLSGAALLAIAAARESNLSLPPPLPPQASSARNISASLTLDAYRWLRAQARKENLSRAAFLRKVILQEISLLESTRLPLFAPEDAKRFKSVTARVDDVLYQRCQVAAMCFSYSLRTLTEAAVNIYRQGVEAGE